MKKILSFTIAMIIGMIGIASIQLWMSPGLTWVHWIGYFLSVIIIAMPVWKHWKTITDKWFI